jgi:predicted Zn-ribbon and HTH transcriptional regulator
MKNEIVIPVPKEEDVVALKKRRENYAYTRDIQAIEYNDSIAKRLLSEARHKSKCEKCGKEFPDGIVSEESIICPECK